MVVGYLRNKLNNLHMLIIATLFWRGDNTGGSWSMPISHNCYDFHSIATSICSNCLGEAILYYKLGCTQIWALLSSTLASNSSLSSSPLKKVFTISSTASSVGFSVDFWFYLSHSIRTRGMQVIHVLEWYLNRQYSLHSSP